jgi:DNA-binding IclR family transcriptional regulator
MKGAARQPVHLAVAARRSIAVTAGISVVAAVLVVVQAGSRAPVHRRAHSAAVLSAADDGRRAGP